ncbi:MAG: CoA pyrophosphatase [SAR324 cluster bacterium]|nr:CoA pyrophosphatase [SAR324 cluster bacterium]
MLKILRHQLSQYSPPENQHTRQRASVLIPIFEKESRLHFLLTRRSSKLRSHSGQVSFPGGKRDESDQHDLDTALREAHEEIGLLPDSVAILGKIDQILSRNFLLVSPYVGMIPSNFVPQPNEFEIESVFHVPLDFFMKEGHHFLQEYQTKRPYFVHHFYYKDYDIWGLTAQLILRFLEIGLNYIPPYPVHHPKNPTWMEQSQLFRDEHIPKILEGWQSI